MIGDVAKRTGVSVSALRFYENKGLISSGRNSGGQRVFQRSVIRRVSFIMITQKLGFKLEDIKCQLDTLPDGRTPNKSDWARLSQHFQEDINTRIQDLETLRDTLDSCIGCGCLSFKTCALYNPQDWAGDKGSGAQYLIKDGAKPPLTKPPLKR